MKHSVQLFRLVHKCVIITFEADLMRARTLFVDWALVQSLILEK